MSSNVDIQTLLQKLNPTCTSTLETALGQALSAQHAHVTMLHWLQELLMQPQSDLVLLCQHYDVDLEGLARYLDKALVELSRAEATKPVFSHHLFEVLSNAWMVSSVSLGQATVRSWAVLIALVQARVHAMHDDFYLFFKMLTESELLAAYALLGASQESKDTPAPQAQSESKSLSKFCEDLTAQAQLGELDPIFGREAEMAKAVDILCRRRKNNPILLGEAGVGKTAIAEGLAQAIVAGRVPDSLKKVRLLMLDVALLCAGASMQGAFEKRFKALLEDIEQSPVPIILFVDEAHTLMGAGGTQGTGDAANWLKPALARGKLRLLAATTFREYKKYMAKDPALVRRFETVQVEAPSEAKTLMIVRGLKSHYEKLQHVVVTDAAVEACVDLSTRFLPGREQPDKAIDLLDTACARAMGRQSSEPVVLQSARAQLEALRRALAALAADRDHGIDIVVSRFKDLKHDISAQEAAVSAHEIQFTTLQQDARDMQAALAARDKKALKALRQKVAKQNLSMPFEVDEHAIAEVVSNWTGVPQGKLLAQEQNVLLNLPEQLQSSIMGQDAAIKEVAQGLQLAKAQIGEPNKPMGVFLLAGPTGVGKTQTALTVADTLFGGTSHLIHINMSEFGERHSVSRLVGSPPGYVGYGEGGVLTEAVKRQPYSVVLLDEVEKAHPDVLDLFYQVFDKGELNDGEGQRVYFYNTVIFLTSNLGQDLLTDCDPKVLGTDECNAELTQELSGFFKPALLARMRTVPYVSLSDKALGSILAAKCNTIGARVKSQYQANLKFSPRLCKHVLALAKARNQGARGIEHVLNERVLSVLSQALLKSFSQTIPPKSWACDYTGKHGVVVEAK